MKTGKNKGFGDDIYLAARVTEDGTGLFIGKFPKIARLLRRMAAGNDEGLLEVRVRELRRNRSDAQNRYYWGVCVVYIMRHLKATQGKDYTRGEVHALNLLLVAEAKAEVRELPDPRDPSKTVNVYVEVGKTTSQMNTIEFNNFISDLQLYWAETGLDIPDPEDDGHNFITGFEQIFDE